MADGEKKWDQLPWDVAAGMKFWVRWSAEWGKGIFHLCSHCIECWAVLGAPKHPSAVSGNSTWQQRERGSAQAGEKIKETHRNLCVPCLVCTVPIKKGSVGPLQCLTKTPWRKFVKVEPILAVGVIKWPSKVKYSVSSCLKLTGFSLLPL